LFILGARAMNHSIFLFYWYFLIFLDFGKIF